MTLRSFIWAPMTEYGEAVAQLPEEVADIPVADFCHGPALSPTPRDDWGYDAYGFLTDGRQLRSGAPQFVRLENVSVLRSSLGGKRYHVVLREGVCAVDSHHDGAWYGKLIGETFELGTALGPVEVNLMEDVPIGATVEAPHVLISHQGQDTYAHTIFETLSKWWPAPDGFAAALPQHPGIPLVWERATEAQRAFATLFHARERLVEMPARRTLYKTLYVPSARSRFSVSRGQAVSLREALRNDIAPAPGVRRLYVSRADAGHRRVANEAELLRALQPLGFEAVTLGGRSVAEQIALFKGAETVVLPHGSACANMIFSDRLTLLELMPESYQQPMWHYWAKWLGFRYGKIVCPEIGAAKDVVVPVDVVLDALRTL
jgi:hypothetical protein